MDPLVSEHQAKREAWRGKYEFVFSLIGYSVGYGNVWRFPYLCYKNGGGCFLLPYVIFLVLVAVPMMLLEVALGQLMQSGAITAWNIVPLFQGVGYAATISAHWVNIYYTVILAWNLYYLFASFTSVLPWSNCDNSWNTDQCSPSDFETKTTGNDTSLNASDNFMGKVLASQEFWNRKVLEISSGLEEPGPVKWDLALCLLLAWILCYLCVWRGVRSTGKIVYFTATFPYVILIVLIIRVLFLDGARDGIFYFADLDLNKLKSGEVWLDAATQVLFSYSIGMGTLTALGSYNKFQTNMYRDCIIFACVNCLTSVISGLGIFALIGYLAKEGGVSIAMAAQLGPGLTFVSIPAAASMMPIAPLWAVLFFIALILMGLDSEFVAIQGFITAVVDWYPEYLRKQYRKEIFTAIMCIFWFLIGLSMMTKGGLYVFEMFDHELPSGSALLTLVFFESIVVGWLFGAEDLYDYVSAMNGYRIFPWIKFCWKYTVPLFCGGILLLNFMSHDVPQGEDEVNMYPDWAWAIRWFILLSSILCIPVVALVKLKRTEGTLCERWRKLTITNHSLNNNIWKNTGTTRDSQNNTEILLTSV